MIADIKLKHKGPGNGLFSFEINLYLSIDIYIY